MKTTYSLFLIAALSLTLWACNKDKWPYCIKGKGEITETTRTVPNFVRITANGSGNVFLLQDSVSDAPNIRIVTNDNIHEHVTTNVVDNRLTIDLDKCVRHMDQLNIYVAVPKLSEVTLNGSGNIALDPAMGNNPFNTSDMKIYLHGSGNITLDMVGTSFLQEISGSGNITLDMVGESLQSTISGSGNITLDGPANTHDATISGSGNVNAYGVPTLDTDVTISGSGNAFVQVENELNVTISGSGQVHYRGTPVVNTSISGSGNVVHEN